MDVCQRFTLKHLKDFGFGRAGLEGVIQGEVKTIIRNKFTIFETQTETSLVDGHC